MIYSKGAETQRLLNPRFETLPLNQCDMSAHTVYWHDQHDIALRSLRLKDALEPKHINHLNSDPTARLLLFYGDEYFNLQDVQWYAQDILSMQIQPEKVYLVTIDANWEHWARSHFARLGVNGINITHYNLLLRQTPAGIDRPVSMTHRFSSFSRNYNDWRLRLFGELAKQDLLKFFNYSFSNIKPYSPVLDFVPLTHLKQKLQDHGQWCTNTELWFSGIPYHLPDADIIDKWSDQTQLTIQSSGIHLLVESHYDAFNHFHNHSLQIDPRDFSPAFLTEKTYKVLFARKPFIAYSTPYFMQELRSLGFQTFDTIIDESYDLETDNQKRFEKIMSEVVRLAHLSEAEFQNLLTAAAAITEHNYGVIQKFKQDIEFPDNFSWIKSHIKKHEYRLQKNSADQS